MEYKIQFGSLRSDRKNQSDQKKFRIAILGDFSARANRNLSRQSDELANIKPFRVHHENLDTLMGQLGW